MMQCWSCNATFGHIERFCPECSILQPVSPFWNYFDILGIEKTFELDSNVLEQAFKRISRQVHPDRFATASPREKRLSLEHATALNDAYRTLKTPLPSALYLVKLLQLSPPDNSQRAILPLDFMEQLMEWREGLSDSKLTRDKDQLDGILYEVSTSAKQVFETLRQQFAMLKASAWEASPEMWSHLVTQVQKATYLQGILDEYHSS